MTALIFVTHSTGIAAYADTASYDDEGIYRAPATKVFALLPIGALVAARGSGGQTTVAKMAASTAESFDDLVAKLSTYVQGAILLGAQANETPNLSLVAGGWSENDQEWQTWRAWAEGRSPIDLDGGALVTERQSWLSGEPWPPNEALETAGATKDGQFVSSGPNGTILDSDIVRLMQVQRDTVFPFGRERGEGCIVGGSIVVTHLGRDETWSKIVHRWPDVIGEKMRTRGDDMPKPPSTAEPNPAATKLTP